MIKFPKTLNGAVHRNPGSFFGYDGWPSVCRDADGVLYTVYSGFRASHICPFGKTCLSRSYDGGKTWSSPIVINDTWLDDRDAGILCLGGKKLMVTWFNHNRDYYLRIKDDIVRRWPGAESVIDQYPSIPEGCGRGGSYIRVSEDGGETWGDTVRVPVSSPHGPILRRDGSVLYLGKEMYVHDITPAGVTPPDVIIAMESRDEGKTWRELGRVPLPDVEGIAWNYLHEPHVLELPDGKLIGVIRGHHPFNGVIYKTESTDGGITWSAPVALPAQGLPPHIMRHSSGALIVTYGYREEPFGERAVISYDNGETWPDIYILRDDATDADLGYPATVELDDHSLLTVYYQQIPGDGFPCIQYTKWTL